MKNQVKQQLKSITMKTTRIELKDSGILFDKECHEYWLGNRQLSGITGMLQRQLFPDEFDNVPEGMLQEAARYGTEVHESIEAFDSSWINDGTQEVQDYIGLCQENGLVHERSEYTVTDGENWASNKNKLIPISPVIHEDWKVKLDGMKIRSNTKSEIITLAGSDSRMQQAIVQGKGFRKEVTFEFLEMLGIRRAKHERRKYEPLINTLGMIGITLVIVSEF